MRIATILKHPVVVSAELECHWTKLWDGTLLLEYSVRLVALVLALAELTAILVFYTVVM